MITREYALAVNQAVADLQAADPALVEAILTLHQAAYEAGVGSAAVVVMEAHQVMREEQEEGHEHYTDV